MGKDKYVTICVALNGFHADAIDSGGNSMSCSGIYAQPYTLEGVVAKLVAEGHDLSGCYVIDKRPAIARHGTGVVYRAPLCGIRLKDDEVSSIDDLIQPGGSIMADALASASGNGYGNLVKGARKGFVNLDSVSPTGYANYWRIHGAIVYHINAKGEEEP